MQKTKIIKKLLILLFIYGNSFAQTGIKTDQQEISKKDSLFFMAYYAAEQGNYNLAVLNYSKVLSINPIEYEAFCNRGYCYFYLGEHEKAISDYSKAIELQPEYRIFNNRGLSYEQIGKYESAINDFDRTIQLAPSFYSAFYNKGRVLLQLDNTEDAIKFHNLALEKAEDGPGKAEVLTSKADICFSKKDYESVLNILDVIIDMGEAYSYTYARIGDVHRRMKEIGKAIKAYDKAISYEHVYPLAYLYRGKMKMSGEFEDIEECKKDIFKYIELEPEDPESYNTLGVISGYLKEGDYCQFWEQACQRGDCDLFTKYCIEK